MEQKVDVWPSVYVDNYSMKPGESSNSRPFFFCKGYIHCYFAVLRISQIHQKHAGQYIKSRKKHDMWVVTEAARNCQYYTNAKKCYIV